jgi:hypothetical protein
MPINLAPPPILIPAPPIIAAIGGATGHFRLTGSRSAQMVRATLSGFWSDETAEAFEVELREQIALIGTAQREHLMLVDMTDFPIQSQSVYGHFRRMLDVGNAPRLLAVIAGDGAGRMQARRLLADRAGSSIHDCEARAMRWLTHAGRA